MKRIQIMFCIQLLYTELNVYYDYTPPPPSSLVDEIQAQYQLSTTARILSAPALQIRAAGARVDNHTAAAASIEVVERLN